MSDWIMWFFNLGKKIKFYVTQLWDSERVSSTWLWSLPHSILWLDWNDYIQKICGNCQWQKISSSSVPLVNTVVIFPWWRASQDVITSSKCDLDDEILLPVSNCEWTKLHDVMQEFQFCEVWLNKLGSYCDWWWMTPLQNSWLCWSLPTFPSTVLNWMSSGVYLLNSVQWLDRISDIHQFAWMMSSLFLI